MLKLITDRHEASRSATAELLVVLSVVPCRMRSLFSDDVAQTLASRLDYCNAVTTPAATSDKLQHAQYNLARVDCCGPS